MGLFDNFFRGVEYKRGEEGFDNSRRGVYRGKVNERTAKFSGAPEDYNKQNLSNVLVFTPNSYEDVQIIIDHLKNHESVILSLKEIKAGTGQRIIDFLSGAIYALGGSIFPIENGMYLLAPDGVNIMTQR